MGGVVAVPAVSTEWLVYADDSFAMFPPRGPEGHVGEDGHVEPELTGGLLKIAFHQAAAEGLVGDFSFSAQKRVHRNFLGVAGSLARNAQALIVFIDSLIQAIRQAQAVARFDFAGEHLVETRRNQ